MQRGFGESEFEPRPEGRDREITLGPLGLIGLAVVLCGLCLGCFLWGYSLGGHHGAEPGMPQEAANSPTTAQLLNQQAKPAPNPSSVQPNPANAPAPAGDAATGPTAAGAVPAAGSTSATQPSGSVVQAALPVQPAVSQPAGAGQVQPALAQATAWMVQIAAVSHQEDADVLVSALRKHGYVVSARHDSEDNLLHVQVGPFTTHSEAASMRQRLLNDGYNAIIEP